MKWKVGLVEMIDNIDFTIIGCTSEIDFLRQISNPYLYEREIAALVKSLDPNNFESEDEFYKRISDINLMKSRYKDLFITDCTGAEYHWHFIEGFEAYSNGLILPALLSCICGIEASLRSTLYLMSTNPGEQLYVKKLMNMDLIHEAYIKGLPISNLAFSNENNFLHKVQNKKKIYLLKIRNDLMHGNIRSYCERHEEERIFTPKHLMEDMIEILMISRVWLKEISDFKINLFNEGV